MQISQADATSTFNVQALETTFSSVWGNEMQREDFLALAAGVRQFSASHADAAFVPAALTQPVEHAQVTAG